MLGRFCLSGDVLGLSPEQWELTCRAMEFYRRPQSHKEPQIARVIREAAERFTHGVCAQAYIDIYENMLHIPLVR